MKLILNETQNLFKSENQFLIQMIWKKVTTDGNIIWISYLKFDNKNDNKIRQIRICKLCITFND
jgi:hypothetical protein